MIESTKDLDGTHRSRDYLDAGTKAVGGELRVFSMEKWECMRTWENVNFGQALPCCAMRYLWTEV